MTGGNFHNRCHEWKLRFHLAEIRQSRERKPPPVTGRRADWTGALTDRGGGRLGHWERLSSGRRPHPHSRRPAVETRQAGMSGHSFGRWEERAPEEPHGTRNRASRRGPSRESTYLPHQQEARCTQPRGEKTRVVLPLAARSQELPGLPVGKRTVLSPHCSLQDCLTQVRRKDEK